MRRHSDRITSVALGSHKKNTSVINSRKGTINIRIRRLGRLEAVEASREELHFHSMDKTDVSLVLMHTKHRQLHVEEVLITVTFNGRRAQRGVALPIKQRQVQTRYVHRQPYLTKTHETR